MTNGVRTRNVCTYVGQYRDENVTRMQDEKWPGEQQIIKEINFDES